METAVLLAVYGKAFVGCPETPTFAYTSLAVGK